MNTVVAPRRTERHTAACCARTSHGKQPVHMIGVGNIQPSPVTFERIDR